MQEIKTTETLFVEHLHWKDVVWKRDHGILRERLERWMFVDFQGVGIGGQTLLLLEESYCLFKVTALRCQASQQKYLCLYWQDSESHLRGSLLNGFTQGIRTRGISTLYALLDTLLKEKNKSDRPLQWVLQKSSYSPNALGIKKMMDKSTNTSLQDITVRSEISDHRQEISQVDGVLQLSNPLEDMHSSSAIKLPCLEQATVEELLKYFVE